MPKISPVPSVTSSVLAAVLCLAVSSGPAAADVVCKKPNGVLVLRATCKKKETSVDLIADGAVTSGKLADGAVSSAKVEDGSITAADLAPGTVGAGTTIQSANMSDLPTGPNAGATRAPIGPSSVANSVVMLAPVAMIAGDFHAVTSLEGIGQAREFRLERASDNSLVVGCTVTSGNDACSSSETGTINAGEAWLLHVTNGPGGSSSQLGIIGYTLKAQ